MIVTEPPEKTLAPTLLFIYYQVEVIHVGAVFMSDITAMESDGEAC